MSTEHITKPDSLEARLEAARARKATRLEKEAAEEAQRAKHEELEELELEERFNQDLGKRGVDYEIVRTAVDGCIVVKRGPAVLYKTFMQRMGKTDNTPTPEDVHNYVGPCIVHPDKATFNKITGERPQVAVRCANALMDLHGAKGAADQGKY